MFDARLPHLPDDWTVWSFSDAHGMTGALVAALQEAGLLDADARWAAPARTALVGCGDYVDRGDDVAGMVELLQRLPGEAAAAGGAAIFARGNHEVMPLMAARGEPAWLETWLEYGGMATAAAYGCAVPGAHEVDRLEDHFGRCAPGLFGWMRSLPQAVRWRDVLFVHAGLVSGFGLDDLGVTTEEHLWVRREFYERTWAESGFETYEADGIGRVVFGHTPQWDGPTLFHEGRSLAIDTNAVGVPHAPAGAVQELTLVGLLGSGAFADAHFVRVPTATAPEYDAAGATG
jgi:hypothetical protein